MDIGANVGNHSLYAALILDVVKIVPFEVDPIALAILEINLWHTKPSRTLQPTRSLSLGSDFCGADVVEVLERVGRQGGFPAVIRVGQGSEFVSRDLELWAYQRSITLDFSRPGKPTDNAFIESFNGKFRAECLNAHWFMSLDDARRKCEAWRRDYNEERPHSAIGNKAPIEPHRSISGARPALRNARKKSAGRSKDGEQFRGKPSLQPWSEETGQVTTFEPEGPKQWD